MILRSVLLTVVSAAALSPVGVAHAGFNDCGLVNSQLAVGSDPIDFARMDVRADGRQVLAYTSNVHNNSSIYFYACADSACGSGSSLYLDTSTNYFGSSGIVIRPSGQPAIVASYFGGVRFYDCADADCDSVSINDIRVNGSGILSDMPIALQANGNPVFLYIDGLFTPRPLYLIVHFCGDADCITSTEQTLAIPPDSASNFGELSLAVGSDGLVAATYLTSEGASNLYTYNIARCSDLACTMVTNTQISAPVGDSSPSRTAVTIRSNQRPLALDNQSNNSALLDCTTSACTTVNNLLLPATAVGQPLGLGLLSADAPAFALFNPPSIGAFACTDSSCATGTALQVTSTAASLLDADFVLSAALQPSIAYIDLNTGALAVAACEPDIFANGFEQAGQQ